ncbi:hypothetical protein B0O99DRAFT_647862 [Bisporella sp. PMI_857]|nr:hypothetical protein B0O99DRAFT_647862 [Bisporella sp. PMI_857]
MLPLLILSILALAIWYTWDVRRKNKLKEESKGNSQALYAITPLPAFNWQATEPLKFRPFKPVYHVTMGITNISPSALLEFDRGYLSRIALRRQIMEDHPSIALNADPSIRPAVDELYAYLIGTYLPTRYPTMFQLSEDKGHLYNAATGLYIPLAPPCDPIETLRSLGENIDEEFLLLTKNANEDQYVLRGYVLCFPSGFNTAEKFGMSLRNIHGPVPGYKEKLELSMDRFFDRLEVGRVVQRSNWSIQTHDRLFVPTGNHLYSGQEAQDEEFDISRTRLRCERQCLWRLPKTRAIIFSFKTYTSPLQDIKEEGCGEALATAIEGLKEGSTPAMYFYKRGVVWGDKVKEYLRGQGEDEKL